MPRISVVIPAYNAAKLLGPTLDSVLRSSYLDFEVIVVDDGSKDDTAAVASSFGPKVRVLSQANAGMSASRNRGVECSDSEFIALVDSDDLWHPRKLEFQIAALDRQSDHAFCFTEFTVWDGNEPESVAFMAQPRSGTIDANFTGWIYHHMILTNWALPSSTIFRRQAWNAMGPFLCADQQTDDWEYFVRCSQSYRFTRLAEPMVLYRQHAASLSRRLPSRNTGELMRESLISRFGMNSKDGTPVDLIALTRERYLGWSNFADAHCARGDLGVGLGAFAKLLRDGPNRGTSLTRIVKSVGRRVFPKRS